MTQFHWHYFSFKKPIRLERLSFQEDCLSCRTDARSTAVPSSVEPRTSPAAAIHFPGPRAEDVSIESSFATTWTLAYTSFIMTTETMGRSRNRARRLTTAKRLSSARRLSPVSRVRLRFSVFSCLKHNPEKTIHKGVRSITAQQRRPAPLPPV